MSKTIIKTPLWYFYYLFCIFLGSQFEGLEAITKLQKARLALRKHIFTNYQYYLRPHCGNSSVNITLNLALRQIIDLNDSLQILHTSIWIRMQWRDCRLSWNKTDFEGIDQILVSNKEVWIPDIALYENVDYVLKGILEYYNVRISSNGTMYYRFPSVVKSSCMLQTKNFPFDKQFCNMTFSSWAYLVNELDLYPASTTGDTSNYVQNSEWALVRLKAIRNEVKHASGVSSELIYVISLERKPFFHILSFIFPCLLISSISLLGFLLPPSSGEKVSIGVTVLLSLSVFLLVVNQTLPANSDEIPYIGIYFASCMMLVSLSCVMAVITVNIHYKSSMGTTFPAWMEKLQQSWLGNMIGPKTVTKNTPETLAEITRTHSSRFNPKKESSCHRRKGIEGLAYHNSSFVSDGECCDDYNDDGISNIEKNDKPNTKEHDGLIETLELFLQYLTTHDGYKESTVGNKWKLFALFLDRTFMFAHIITFILTTAALLILCAYF
ncbi:neuronal acetylcholine receptor subunit alpha-10 isoform X2 [Octopus bimaculoides]|uniref:neuronal acetylcholine receptor subunit alpha-10 isoform X2 n=1 Tax=Octopus bimaculoides TaxID=37653 RepID=UPI00071C9634|nr:neuronal acetylcholine receptor subunit alpha-10 isoform X2 [Octopus bimaculoides]|eukprot:XP_014786698.1 PREDICTED: neuronal acetylcholine receptor subunit alpha-10-like isoform X2 [Octopus bimaculoides]